MDEKEENYIILSGAGRFQMNYKSIDNTEESVIHDFK